MKLPANVKLFTIATGILVFSTITVGVLMTRYITGEEGILEATLIQSNVRLVSQALDRIEQQIIKEDRKLYELSAVISLDELLDKLKSHKIPPSSIVDRVYLLDSEGRLLFPDSDDWALIRLLQNRIYPQFQKKRIHLQSVHHLHTSVDMQYYLFSFLKFQIPGNNSNYTLAMQFNLKDLDKFFAIYIEDLLNTYTICIQDYDRNIIYGTPIIESQKYFAEQRFPNTFYRWIFQISPLNAIEIERDERNRRYLIVSLIVLNLFLILSSWFLVYLGRKKEVKLTRQKEEFIRNVSHEMKTPLSLIKMFSEILIMGRNKDDKTRHEYLEIIFAETERLTFLINNILDFSNLERGLQTFCFEQIDLTEMVREHLEVFDYRIKKDNVKIQIETDGPIPTILGDRNAISLVLLNLLDNAIKYHGTKEKLIRIQLFTDNHFVCLQVTDSGIGISSSDLNRIFEKFYRSDDIEVRRIRGSGIGLSLVKYLVEAHGGTIDVESVPGEGTSFTIKISPQTSSEDA